MTGQTVRKPTCTPHHPLALGRGHFLSMESGHEPFYTHSQNTFLHLGAISSPDQKMGDIRYWELVLPVLAFRLWQVYFGSTLDHLSPKVQASFVQKPSLSLWFPSWHLAGLAQLGGHIKLHLHRPHKDCFLHASQVFCERKTKRKKKKEKRKQPLPFYHITWARTQWLPSFWPAGTEQLSFWQVPHWVDAWNMGQNKADWGAGEAQRPVAGSGVSGLDRIGP